MNKHYSLILSVSILVTCILSVTLASQEAAAQSGKPLLLLYSNDVKGEIEACG